MELQNENPDINIKRYSIFDDPVDITSKLVGEEREYSIFVKENDHDSQRPIWESKTTEFIVPYNSMYAVVDNDLKSKGLIPKWVSKDGNIYLEIKDRSM